MLAEIQGILDDLDMADNLFVKYSTEEDWRWYSGWSDGTGARR